MQQPTVIDFFSEFPIRTYSKGDIIIFANTGLESVYLIEKGSVLQYDISPSGNKYILNTFKEDAFFPMSNAVNEVDTPYFFEAAESVQVRVAPASKVVSFIRDNPGIMYDLLKRVYRGMDGVFTRQAELTYGDASSKILRELQISADRFGSTRVATGLKLSQRMNETELAQRAGLSRETVSRTVVKLKASGQLTVERGGIYIISV